MVVYACPSSPLSTMVVRVSGYFKRKAYFRTVTYSIEQLTIGCVDEMSMCVYTSTSLRRMTITYVSVEYKELNDVSHWLSLSWFPHITRPHLRLIAMNFRYDSASHQTSIGLYCKAKFIVQSVQLKSPIGPL